MRISVVIRHLPLLLGVLAPAFLSAQFQKPTQAELKMTVEGAPKDTSIVWPGQAVCVTKSVAYPGQIIMARKLARAFTFVKQDEYQDLRGFYQKVAAADQGELVLIKNSDAKGNQ